MRLVLKSTLIFIFTGSILTLVIVCHCRGVTDRAIRRAVRQGASTRRQVAQACGAGAGCGGCRISVQKILESEDRSSERSVSGAIGDLAPTR
jgi:bacterioferritin-associated ferredoxin